MLEKALQRANEIITKEMSRRPKRLNDSIQHDMNSSIADAELGSSQFEMQKTLTVNELTVSKEFIAKTINGHKLSELVCEESDLNLKNFTVDELVIANNPENFEAIEEKLHETDKRFKRDAPISDSEPLFLNNVIVEGSVNGVNLSYFMDNVLRTNAESQRLEAPIHFGTLRARSIETFDGKISDVNLMEIARINANESTIRPPMRFTQPIQVGFLKVEKRLNHILIDNGKMDALFKRSRRTQVITGLKEFESVVLLEPIILQGKINVSSPIFGKINPIVTIDEDVIVEESVSFLGNVSITNLLQTQNIYGKSIRYNVGQLFSDGLRLDEQSIDIAFEFKQPIQVEDVLAPTRINNVPIESLIKRNVTHVQNVTASKSFTTDLTVEGECNTNEINGINLAFLNHTMLRRSAKNQVVTGTIQFGRIIAGK